MQSDLHHIEGAPDDTVYLVELRRTITLAMIYPLMVAAVAYGLFLFLLVKVLPVSMDSKMQFGLNFTPDPMLNSLQVMRDHIWMWAPWLPLIAIAVLIFLGARTFRYSPNKGFLGIGRLRYAGGVATFSELLALLVQ